LENGVIPPERNKHKNVEKKQTLLKDRKIEKLMNKVEPETIRSRRRRTEIMQHSAFISFV
jgi:hypothetical protein